MRRGGLGPLLGADANALNVMQRRKDGALTRRFSPATQAAI
jgi:hypothetical protein